MSYFKHIRAHESESHSEAAEADPEVLIERINQAEAQYQKEPNDERADDLACMYEELLELLEKKRDVEQYSFYCCRYYALKIYLFKRDPDILEHINLATSIEQSVKFVEQSGSTENTIKILQIAVDYWNYCTEIGYEDDEALQRIQSKLSGLL